MRFLLCTSLLFLCLFTFSENGFGQGNASNNPSTYNEDILSELINDAEQKEDENTNQTVIPITPQGPKIIPKKTPDSNLKVGTKVYLGNLEDSKDVKTVYKVPGLDWVSCKKIDDVYTGKDYCEEATGWPNQDANIEIIGNPETRVVTDPFTGELVEEVYHHIKFDYKVSLKDGRVIPASGTGYLAESYLTTKKYDPVYGVAPNDLLFLDKDSRKKLKLVQDEISKEIETNSNVKKLKSSDRKKVLDNQKKENPESATVVQKPKPGLCEDNKEKNFSFARELINIQKKIVNEKLNFLKQTNTIYDSIGQCMTDPADVAPTSFSKGNVFDNLVLSDIKTSHKLNITGEDDKPVTTDDLISIDAMARTLYGEMGQCFNKGMQYPMSVARIIVNRSESKKYRKLFIKGPHEEDKSDIAKVATSPSQFNNWMKKNKNNPNGPLHHSLCPPKTVNEPFWKGKGATKNDVEVWRNAVRIATEAVIYPKKFKKRTNDLKDVYFYTSGMGKFYNSKLITNKEIDDRPIDNERCIELWTFPTTKKKVVKKDTPDTKRTPASKKKKTKKK